MNSGCEVNVVYVVHLTCQCEFHYILTVASPFVVTAKTVPTEPPTTCSDLTVPANGMISYNMGTASLRPVNTVATYTCVTGYTLIGGSTRTCGSDGVWSVSAPTCERKWNGLCTVCLLSVSSPIQLTALT